MKILFLLAAVIFLFSSCAYEDSPPNVTRYEASFLGVFDTVTTIVGYAESEETFRETAESIYESLLEYHRLFDIYHEYPGISNLKTINDSAAVHPVKTDPRIIDLLLFCKEAYKRTNKMVNTAMGSVLSLWHTARLQNALPDQSALLSASAHTDFEKVIIDPSDDTVLFTDPEILLDVGAIAKGYAVRQICRSAPAGLLLSVGGNVCATGPKPASDGLWNVGIRSPNNMDENLLTVRIQTGCVVTSGDYQRFFTVSGKRYHHIIHPKTLRPCDLWRSVSVVCGDSAVADMLSTALFLMSYDDGKKLLESFNAHAMWVTADGSLLFSDHFPDLIKS